MASEEVDVVQRGGHHPCNPAGMEEFFRAAGWDLSDPRPQDWVVNVEAMRSAAEACGQRVLGPPLAADDEVPATYLG